MMAMKAGLVMAYVMMVPGVCILTVMSLIMMQVTVTDLTTQM